MNRLNLIARRLREPSSIAGLGLLGVLFGLKPEVVDPVIQAVAAVAGVVAVLVPEGQGETK